MDGITDMFKIYGPHTYPVAEFINSRRRVESGTLFSDALRERDSAPYGDRQNMKFRKRGPLGIIDDAVGRFFTRT